LLLRWAPALGRIVWVWPHIVHETVVDRVEDASTARQREYERQI